MSLALDLASWLLLGLGVALCLVGGLGLLRLPEFYLRIHAAGVTDTLGAWSILLGLALQSGWSLVTVKLLLVGLFLLLTSPAASHALAKAAYAHGVRAESPVLDHRDGASRRSGGA